jgi:hypothetical protein
MNVRELIEKLSGFNPELIVVSETYDEHALASFYDIEPPEVLSVEPQKFGYDLASGLSSGGIDVLLIS